MPTVISDPLRLAFVHIPKCGGSTIGPQLAAQVACDPYFLQTRWVDHPALGKLMPSHVPLWAMRDHFPEAFARLRAYDGFAICREPRARFLSALSQHARELRRIDVSRIDRAGLLGIVDEVIAAFDAGPQALLHAYIHFVPQSDFVVLEGEAVVTNLWAIEALPDLARALSARSGAAIDGEERHNKTNFYRSDLVKSSIARLKPVAERLLPTRLFRTTRRIVLAAATVPVQDQLRAVLDAPRVADFIARTYAADAALHARMRATVARPGSAPP